MHDHDGEAMQRPGKLMQEGQNVDNEAFEKVAR